MTVHRLGTPSQLKSWLEDELPQQISAAGHPQIHGRPMVIVIPRDEAERRCAVWAADHYELCVFYAVTNAATLNILEEQMRLMPGVYATTQVTVSTTPRKNAFSNPDWPVPLGVRRRDRDDLRPMVLALAKDEVIPPPDPPRLTSKGAST